MPTKCRRLSLGKRRRWDKQHFIKSSPLPGWQRDPRGLSWVPPRKDWQYFSVFLHWHLVPHQKGHLAPFAWSSPATLLCAPSQVPPKSISKTTTSNKPRNPPVATSTKDYGQKSGDSFGFPKSLCTAPLHANGDCHSESDASGSAEPPNVSGSNTFRYDKLDREKNTIRVISFEAEQWSQNSEEICCRLETVDMDEYVSLYARCRNAASILSKGETKYNLHQERQARFLWRVFQIQTMWEASGGTEIDMTPDVLKSAWDKWKEVRDTSRDIDHGGSWMWPRFQWGDFLALSYVWGDSTEQQQIMLNEQPFPVNKNLYNALKRLKQSKEVRECKLKVWVDAICINQQDVAERGFQVTKMATIYAQAACVRGWIGEPETRWTEAVTVLQGLIRVPWEAYEANATLLNLPGPGAEKDYYCDAQLESLISKVPAFELTEMGDLLKDILNEQYWERLWIMQELHLSCSAVVWYGDSCFNVTQLGRLAMLVGIEYIKRRMVGGKEFTRLFEKPGVCASERHDQFFWEFRHLDIHLALLLAQNANCSDLRDRVYGILELINLDITKQIQVDYHPRKTFEDVSLDFSIACILAEQNPVCRAPFAISETQFSGAVTDARGRTLLPTWAFDLRRTTTKRPKSPGSEWSWRERVLPNPELQHIGQSQAGLTFSSDRQHLNCKGFFVDAIHRTGPWLLDWSVHKDAETSEGSKKLPKEVSSQFYSARNDIAPSRLAVSRILLNQPYYEAEDFFDPLQLPWCLIERIYKCPRDTRFDPNDPRAHAWLWYGLTYLGDFQLGDRTLKEYFSTNEGPPALGKGHPLYGHAPAWERGARGANVIKRSRLMTSFQGFMGRVPPLSQPGDLICVFPGHVKPVVLRRKGTNYQLIGDCFVEGLMRGEPFKRAAEGRLKPVDITLC